MPFIIGVVGSAAQGTRRASGGGGGYGTVTGYFNATGVSDRFCANAGGGNMAITLYFSGTGTKTFQQAYASGSTLFTDNTLIVSASAGIYGDTNGGTSNKWFEWKSVTGWGSSGTCS